MMLLDDVEKAQSGPGDTVSDLRQPSARPSGTAMLRPTARKRCEPIAAPTRMDQQQLARRASARGLRLRVL
jgi:hypothetical protein